MSTAPQKSGIDADSISYTWNKELLACGKFLIKYSPVL